MLENPHVQSTAGLWPDNHNLKEYMSMPLALSLQPFANTHPQASISRQQINQYRCQSCKAFINRLCFMRNDYEYDCSLCGCTNKTVKPIDLAAPELNSLSYILRAPQKQRLLTSEERLVVFVLDLSFYGVQSKQYLLYALQVIRSFVISAVNNKIPMNIMIVGFDSGLHRFHIQRDSENTQLRITSSGGEEEGDDQYFMKFQLQIGNIQTCRENIEKVLNLLESEVANDNLRYGRSLGLMQAIKYSLRASKNYSGKIMIVSGLRQQIGEFKQSLQRYFYDVSQQHNFSVNTKQCIKGQLLALLNVTQMSISVSFINSHFVNNMPFLYMTKHTNGQLRHYFPNQLSLFFHWFRQDLESMLQEKTAFQSLLRVRYSTGLKLKGIFGSYRPTKVSDQIQLLTCPQSCSYLFQFIIEGKIAGQLVIVQFSSLFTDLKGQRCFVIETYANKISGDPNLIIPTINYSNISVAYVRGIIHNLDSPGSTRNLQLALQQRCKKHIKAIRQYNSRQYNALRDEELQWQTIRQAKPYVIITFLLMKHFLLNQNYSNIIHFDLNAQARSKVATFEDSINIIWPLVYVIRESGWKMVQMSGKYISQDMIAVLIDRCDQHYAYVANPQLQGRLKTGNAKKNLYEIIQNEESLKQLKKLIEQIKHQKRITYIDILPLDNLHELKILDLDSEYGFDKFIVEITKE